MTLRPPPPEEEPPPPPDRGTFAQAHRLKEAALSGRLREATLDLGAAHIDNLRSIFAARVSQTRDRLNGLTLAASQVDEPTRSLGLRGNVRALGLGLLERTEAVLDLLLQLADAEKHSSQKDVFEDEDGEGDAGMPAGFLRLPRTLSSQVFQTFAVRLTESRSVRVTFVGMQDTCTSLLQRLRNHELLRKVHNWAEEKQKELSDDGISLTTPKVAASAANIARLGCEKLLGERVGRFLESQIILRLLGFLSLGEATQDSKGSAVLVEEILEESSVSDARSSHALLAELGELGELHSGRGRCLRLVVKNSFIELVEDESPRERRRARSCEAAIVFAEEPRDAAQAPSAQRVSSRAGLATPEGDDEFAATREECRQGTASQVGAHTAASSSQVSSGGGADDTSDSDRMTVMLRNVPPEYTRCQLLQLLDIAGFRGKYDFVYLPMDFTHGCSLGYALVGLVDHEWAREVLGKLQGIAFPWSSDGSLRCQTSWSEPHKGLAEHIERYRNSPVMHPSMPDEYKPVIFVNGERVAFPQPTKTIRAPRIRHPKVRS